MEAERNVRARTDEPQDEEATWAEGGDAEAEGDDADEAMADGDDFALDHHDGALPQTREGAVSRDTRIVSRVEGDSSSSSGAGSGPVTILESPLAGGAGRTIDDDLPRPSNTGGSRAITTVSVLTISIVNLPSFGY